MIDATILGKPASEIVQDMIARGVFRLEVAVRGERAHTATSAQGELSEWHYIPSILPYYQTLREYGKVLLARGA